MMYRIRGGKSVFPAKSVNSELKKVSGRAQGGNVVNGVIVMFSPTQSLSCYLETDFINLSDEELNVCKQSFNPVIYLRHGSLQDHANIYTNDNRSGIF